MKDSFATITIPKKKKEGLFSILGKHKTKLLFYLVILEIALVGLSIPVFTYLMAQKTRRLFLKELYKTKEKLNFHSMNLHHLDQALKQTRIDLLLDQSLMRSRIEMLEHENKKRKK